MVRSYKDFHVFPSSIENSAVVVIVLPSAENVEVFLVLLLIPLLSVMDPIDVQVLPFTVVTPVPTKPSLS